METLSQKTISVSKENALAQKKWVVVDAEGQILGRMCSKVAKILRGKYKPCFTPNQDCGDNVIIVNAAKIELTGKKMTDHVYIRYTGYPVVKGMLPKNRLGNRLITNLYVFDGPEHNMQAQQPVKIDINTLK